MKRTADRARLIFYKFFRKYTCLLVEKISVGNTIFLRSDFGFITRFFVFVGSDLILFFQL